MAKIHDQQLFPTERSVLAVVEDRLYVQTPDGSHYPAAAALHDENYRRYCRIPPLWKLSVPDTDDEHLFSAMETALHTVYPGAGIRSVRQDERAVSSVLTFDPAVLRISWVLEEGTYVLHSVADGEAP